MNLAVYLAMADSIKQEAAGIFTGIQVVAPLALAFYGLHKLASHHTESVKMLLVEVAGAAVAIVGLIAAFRAFAGV
jgi:hypothetical protein